MNALDMQYIGMVCNIRWYLYLLMKSYKKKTIHVYICHEHVYSQCLTYFKWKCSTITYLISESSRVYIHDV